MNNSNIPWEVRYHPDAQKELDRLDGSVRKIVLAGIKKVSANPVSKDDGGYGKPLGNKGGNNLTGYFKIKYRKIGIRVVYKLIIEVFDVDREHLHCVDKCAVGLLTTNAVLTV